MSSNFFATLSRMKYITRWSLMRNTRGENLCEHSFETAIIVHALALLTNQRFSGHVDVERCVLLALYHDASEILTGDLPTPIKYYNPAIRDAYKQVEDVANQTLLSKLPEDLQGAYAQVFSTSADEEEARLVKAADKLSALIKCVEECSQGNREFEKARVANEEAVRAMHIPAADCFLEEFLPAYALSLDEQD